MEEHISIDWPATFRHIIVGMVASMMFGYFLTLVIISMYCSHEFNIHGVVLDKIPQEIKNKYKSKLLMILETMCWYLRQKEEEKIEEEEIVEVIKRGGKRSIKGR